MNISLSEMQTTNFKGCHLKRFEILNHRNFKNEKKVRLNLSGEVQVIKMLVKIAFHIFINTQFQ